ncbi:uncharacterized protein LOC101753522 [Setaria italica]|uniref:uncharacterized protein LOC101753522 n=1 Tax=Setaria italica TaxID=4555 RepID=UPI000BE53E80|nr:uncharacterized protein LOC101753522 [Setaria italica]
MEREEGGGTWNPRRHRAGLSSCARPSFQRLLPLLLRPCALISSAPPIRSDPIQGLIGLGPFCFGSLTAPASSNPLSRQPVCSQHTGAQVLLAVENLLSNTRIDPLH